MDEAHARMALAEWRRGLPSSDVLRKRNDRIFELSLKLRGDGHFQWMSSPIVLASPRYGERGNMVRTTAYTVIDVTTDLL